MHLCCAAPYASGVQAVVSTFWNMAAQSNAFWCWTTETFCQGALMASFDSGKLANSQPNFQAMLIQCGRLVKEDCYGQGLYACLSW